jgi:hypothetical protein
MIRHFLALGAALAVAAPCFAAESVGSAHEKPMILAGTVVDLVCELTNSCTSACGAGKRQLGLRLADGTLVAIAKGPVNFAGPVLDLAPLCGRAIITDGLMIENPAMRIYQVQGIKTDAAAPAFAPADAYTADWIARHGKADEWFRADPRTKALIERTGPLGRSDLKPKPQ